MAKRVNNNPEIKVVRAEVRIVKDFNMRLNSELFEPEVLLVQTKHGGYVYAWDMKTKGDCAKIAEYEYDKAQEMKEKYGNVEKAIISGNGIIGPRLPYLPEGELFVDQETIKEQPETVLDPEHRDVLKKYYYSIF